MNTIQNTPIIDEVDFIILGGGLREVTAAICLSKNGGRVLLLTAETYLLDDLCNHTMYITPISKDDDNPILQQIISEEVYQVKGKHSNKWALHPDKLKRNAESVCEQYGITYLYNVRPLDIITTDNVKTLRIGGKFGVSGITCEDIIDFKQRDSIVYHSHYHVHIMDLPPLFEEEHFIIHGSISNYEICLIPGAYDNRHGILQVPCDERNYLSRTDYLIACKQKCLEAYEWLKTKHQEFLQIRLGRFINNSYHDEYDYYNEYQIGMRILDCRKEFVVSSTDFEGCFYTKTLGNAKKISMSGRDLFANNPDISKRNYKVINTCYLSICNELQYDVVVVGGGTAGAMAALHASRNGLRVLLLEMNRELGGTGTVGGVSTYWFGKRFRDVLEVDIEIQKVYQKLEIERNPGIWSPYDDCNPGIKSMILMQMCKAAGVIIQYCAHVFAAIKDSVTSRVTGVMAVTEDGVKGCYGTYVVDATGDGDIATFAGAKACYGSKRDYITYWGSLAQYVSPEKYKNNFSSTLMVSDPFDYTRFIRLGRCRGENTFDHGTYVSPRESRHIMGLYEMDLKDLASYRTYEDGIYTCFSNYDPKGKLSADMVYAGVLPPQVSIQIPLRALLPVNQNGTVIPGIILAGKAISCTHNAFPSIRMQPDLMHQGTVIGRILAEALHTETELTQLEGDKLKKIITEYTGDLLTLTKNTLMVEEIVQEVSHKDRCHWVDYPFEEEVMTEERCLRIMTEDSKVILPLLEQRFLKVQERCIQDEKKVKKHKTANQVLEKQLDNQSDRELLCLFLLWHGSDLGIKEHLEAIRTELLRTEGLPIRRASTMCAQLLPDHGIMPEVVYRMNLLAWSKSEGILEPFELVLKKLKVMNRDYLDIKQGIYHYIEAFPYVAERTGRKEFIPLLLELRDLSELREARKPENKVALLSERFLILVLSINRALARCGEKEGFKGLIQLLSIDSLPIAASACKELENLTGNEFGLDVTEWREVLKNVIDPLPMQLITEKVW